MKSTLVIYHGKEHTKFERPYQTVTMNPVDGVLQIFNQDLETSDETLSAAFKNWDRIYIEGD